MIRTDKFARELNAGYVVFVYAEGRIVRSFKENAWVDSGAMYWSGDNEGFCHGNIVSSSMSGIDNEQLAELIEKDLAVYVNTLDTDSLCHVIIVASTTTLSHSLSVSVWSYAPVYFESLM